MDESTVTLQLDSVQPETSSSGSLGVPRVTRGLTLLTAAGVISGIGTLAFNVELARIAGADAYGALGVLLAMGTAAGLLALGVQFTTARHAALGRTPDSLGALVRATPVWCALPLALGPFAPFATNFLHLSSPLPVALTLLTFVAYIAIAVPSGILIGLGRVEGIALAMVVAVTVRLASGAAFALVMGATTGGTLATLVSALAALAVSTMWALREPSGVPGSLAPVGPSGAESAVGALFGAGSWAIWSLPLLFGRHWLAPGEAGTLAASQLFCGGLFFLTAPVVTVAFPEMVRRPGSRAVIRLFASLVGICVVVLIGLVAVGPRLVGILYGPEFVPDRGLIAMLSLGASMVAATSFWIWAARAVRRGTVAVSTGLGIALATEAVAASVWHSSGVELALGLLGGALAGVGVAVATSALLRGPVALRQDTTGPSSTCAF